MKILPRLILFLEQVWAVSGIALKRLLTQRFLSLAAIAGLMIAAGFILSIPLYADATYFRLFREELFAGRDEELLGRPVDYAPLAFIFNLNVAGRDSPQWPDAVEADEYLSRDALRAIRFPILEMVRRFRTDEYFLHPPGDGPGAVSQYYLAPVNLAFLTPMDETIQVVGGLAPEAFASPLLGLDAVQALVSESLAEQFGIQPGDVYYLRRNNNEVPVVISGLWRPLDPNAPYWDRSASQWLIVHEDSYTGAVSELVPDELRDSVWYIVADGARLHAGDVAGLERRIREIEENSALLLPNTRLVSSPLGALDRYQRSAPALTYLLFAFSVPVLGLILAFIGLVTGLFVGQQRGEMAILRSRGASSVQVVGISMLQGLLLGIAALAGGVPLGYWIAHAIGWSRSFLDFSASGGLRVSMTASVLGYGLLGIGLILLFQFLIPALGIAGSTIVTYKQERARLLRPPWWQRYWLDVILLLPAGYGLWQLQRQSRLALAGAAGVPEPLQNPLLLIAPAIGIFAVALFTLRLIPRVMEFASWLLRPTASVGVLMAARYLARTPAFYSAPLVLLLLTLGLSTFTASLARTLDSHLEKQMYYEVGADLNIYELGTTISDLGANRIYTFRPVEEHLGLDGVFAATRVGQYNATVVTPGGLVEGRFMGIDRLTFPDVAYWQRDFASRPLRTLLNGLGADPGGVLVPGSLLDDLGLAIGDRLAFGVRTGAAGFSVPLELRIAGTFDLFPTWYPDAGPIFVGNLDTLFMQAGEEYPHEVWLRTSPDTVPEDVVYAVRGYSILLDQRADQARLVENGLNTQVERWSSAGAQILAEQKRPERQGLFGLLSVGFIASALLTVLGFMLYALFSFRRRFIEMGMLRAIGLSVEQMKRLLAAELASLILLGVGVGTLLGIVASRMFVPFLQIGTATRAQFPPFQIEIAWFSIIQIYILFILLFVAALAVLSRVLVQMKIFQAIKLGETG